MCDVTVRLARLVEAELLTDLAVRAKASWGYDERFMAQCRTELTLTPEKMQAWKIWVAEYKGRIVGMIALAANGDIGEIEDLMVEPDLQGRGVGGALMSALLDECRLKNITCVGLDSEPNAT
jgi:GNAT superfamily N-acetyltransferase